MKKRLSEAEYKEVAQYIRTMGECYWEAFRMTTGHFPKNGKTIRRLLALNRAWMEFDYAMEDEFFRDFPEKKLAEYRPPITREGRDYGE